MVLMPIESKIVFAKLQIVETFDLKSLKCNVSSFACLLDKANALRRCEARVSFSATLTPTAVATLRRISQ